MLVEMVQGLLRRSSGTVMTETNAHLRWMIRKDMPFVLSIEEQSFEHPKSEHEFILILRERDVIGMVAEVNDDVVGYMIYRLERKKLKLLSFAVHPECRRKGIGRAMIGRLILKLVPGRRSRIETHVADTNLDCQLFLREMGFVCTKMERGFYEHSPEVDAYLMECFAGE